MTTFNTDSLDFVDDEEIRTGDDDDFATRFDSGNSRLEIEDLTAGAVAHVPQGTATDLVGGKFAETVSEGKALADDGEVYDTIQGAVNNASSWVKVGPGDFRESVDVTTTGITISGSGERTFVDAEKNSHAFNLSTDSTLRNLRVSQEINADDTFSDVITGATGSAILNVTVEKANDKAIRPGTDGVVANCTINSSQGKGIESAPNTIIVGNVVRSTNISQTVLSAVAINVGEDSICANNVIPNGGNSGFYVGTNDAVVIANRVSNVDSEGIRIEGTDNIIANNRVSNSGNSNINDGGTGTVLDANLTT